MIQRILMIVLAAVLGGCGGQEKKKEPAAELARYEYSDNRVEVAVMELREAPFRQQIATNGKLRAGSKSVLAFKTSGTIDKVHVSNGDRVSAGTVLAELDRTEVQNALTAALQSFEKAKIDLNDAIIGFGYGSAEDPQVPERTMELAKIRSGYNVAELNLENARNAVAACTLKAPFDGKVATITGHPYERSGAEFCILVDDARLVAAFSVLETELDFVRKGNVVKVASFFSPENYVNGRITSVNPLVDNNGQVLVEAEIVNNGTFVDGMNVKLLVEKVLPGQLVVPKSAVVMRDNYEVLFRYRDGKAYWTYVHTVLDNSSEYVVTANTERGADLAAGDLIIVSGNLNLGNETAVVVKP
ncbi:MAG: efflux RND transporter periplasmic adaptor subunit [Culturomica sp.]|jgi:RND family efflux transporter MFP subunit|nr:efflux RND transporter periplasmic adaptor subunit [Culturomica sp.]